MTSILTLPRVQCLLTAVLTSGTTISPTTADVDLGVNQLIPVGAAAGQVSNAYCTLLSITSGAPQTLDMTSLVDALGNAINFARVQGLVAVNFSQTPGQDLTIQGGGTNPLFGDIRTVMAGSGASIPGGVEQVFNWSPGWAVSGAAKTVKYSVAAGTAVQIGVAILGNTT